MIDSIGIDLVENSRIAKKIDTPNFLEHILTKAELVEYYNLKGKKQLEYLCGRFAAKEAIIKATHKYETPHLLDIEILKDPDGSPNAHFKDYQLLISISHEKHYTIAEAILL